MLTYLTTAEATDTTVGFLENWGASLAPEFAVRTYQDVVGSATIPSGAFIFSDLERLSNEGLALAARLWTRLAEASAAQPPLNDPSRHRRRGDLLRLLSDAGVNDFRAHSVEEPPEGWRYPVFLRYGREHWGPMTGLLASPTAVRRALRRARLIGHRPEDLLAIEFCDTAGADGMYRKYGAYVVGQEIVPRHVLVSRSWVLRSPPEDVEPHLVREERDYLETNPHEDVLREIFRLAEIEYGRIDYGLLDGRVQVWEINTNPGLMSPTPGDERQSAEALANHQFFADAIVSALSGLVHTPVGPAVEVGDLWDGLPWPSRLAGVQTRRGRIVLPAAHRLRQFVSRTQPSSG